MQKSMLILVAGPYRSVTNDNPDLIHANVKAMNITALKIHNIGAAAGTGRMVCVATDRNIRI